MAIHIMLSRHELERHGANQSRAETYQIVALVTYTKELVAETLELVVSMCTEPVVNAKTLIDATFGLFLIEHIGSKLLFTSLGSTDGICNATNAFELKTLQQNSGDVCNIFDEDLTDPISTGGLFGEFLPTLVARSPKILLFSLFVIMFSILASVVQTLQGHFPSIFGSRQRTVRLLYLMIFFFCLENVLLLACLLLACHTIATKNRSEEQMYEMLKWFVWWIGAMISSSAIRIATYRSFDS